MALANVAFLAAMNGMRVLMMDWDLEAPGLGYYFRGLMDPAQARGVKAAPGILNLAWDWVSTIRQQGGDEARKAHLEHILQGNAFEECVRSVVDDDLLMDRACLHILRAGNDTIDQGLSYEEALAEFSWPQFFKNDGGGLLLNALTEWARERYDLVLIDSRTGLADVAGICTIQLPDLVALCFIFNRQNMEGVAKVAGAIRAKRTEEVRLRAVPMRVASRDTSEEASARARARRELTTVGGFSGEAVDEDFRLLSIEASANVPFYETLAPVIANDPLKDPLSQNYLALASSLLNRPLTMPEFSSATLDRIQRRLQPRHATADYLLQLKSSVPERMFEEVSHLVESALDAQLEHDADLEDEYLIALVRAAFDIADESEDQLNAWDMLNQALDLARSRAAEQPGAWRQVLVESIGRMLDYAGYLENDEELALLDEIEALMAPDPTIAARLARIRYRRRAARTHLFEDDYQAVFQSIAEIRQIIESLERSDLAGDQLAQLAVAEAEIHLLRGDVYSRQDSRARADQEFERGRSLLDPTEGRSELARLRFEFSRRLATSPLVDPQRRANLALEAARNGGSQTVAHVVFNDLARSVLAAPDATAVVPQFVEAAFRADRLSSFANYQGRHPRFAAQFFETAARLVTVSAALPTPQGKAAVQDIARASTLVARILLRRRATWPARMRSEDLGPAISMVVLSLERAGCEPSAITELRQYMALLAQHRPPRRIEQIDIDEIDFS